MRKRLTINSVQRALVAMIFLLSSAAHASEKTEPTVVKSTGFMAVPEDSESSSPNVGGKTEAPAGQASTSFSQTEVPTRVYTQTNSEVQDTRVSSSSVTPVQGLSQEEALRKAWLDELDAIKKKEELELQALRLREETERHSAEINQELNAKKRKIYDLQTKQDQYAEEITQMKSEIVEMDGKAQELQKDVTAAEDHAKIHQDKHNEVKKDLEQTKDQMLASLETLRKTREATSKKVNQYLIEMQQFRAEIATTEADIARADNDRVRAEAEELQVRSQWSALAARTQSLRQDKARMFAELNDMKTRLQIARKDFALVKSEFDKADKEKNEAVALAAKQKSEINAEMRKIEQDTAYVYNQKSNDEAEKVRLAAEIDKLKTDLAYVKKRNADTHQEASESEGTVMESRLAFETAKADMTRELSSGEAAQLRDDARAVQMRTLASVAEGSDMVDAHKAWVASKNCMIMRNPSSGSEAGGRVSTGERLIAAPTNAGYVKILNASGKPAYLPMDCGHFAQ